LAKVFLTSATDLDDEHGRLELSFLQESAAKDRFGVHVTTDDPERADIVIFVEREDAAGSQQESVLAHPLYHAFKEKTFVVNPRFKGAPRVPGVYASIPYKWYDRSQFRSGHYLEVIEDDALCDQGDVPKNAHLYSFRGKIGTAPVRKQLVDLDGPQGVIASTDSLNFTPKMQMEASPSELHEYRSDYASLVRKSKFVLCPRGVGPASLRLFETMLMGRAPVIIADQWVSPRGPAWDRFSIRIAESDVRQLPNVLEQYEEDAAAMGRRARHAWENWFSPMAGFHRTVQWCLQIEEASPSVRDTVSGFRAYAHRLFASAGLDQWLNYDLRSHWRG